VVNQVNGHSTRVGAAQDLAALDIDLAAITQAGGWKSTRMPLQYAEKINAARSGMARVAAAVSGFGNPIYFGGQKTRLTARASDRRGTHGIIGEIISKRTACRIKSLFGEEEK
jgi:hypothetical protein